MHLAQSFLVDHRVRPKATPLFGPWELLNHRAAPKIFAAQQNVTPVTNMCD
jgi:hypothetical protein